MRPAIPSRDRGNIESAATGYVEGFNAAAKELVSIEWLNSERRALTLLAEQRVSRDPRSFGRECTGGEGMTSCA